jgi:LysR family transcriptional regulator, benzoate and cis,cis-muconate-responsive activator of ben and cat genes
MELRHIRYFIVVAEEENVSRAALKLHVSQPALSRQVRDLEDELGFLLLERSAKSVKLTEAGRVFLAEARAVLERVDLAVKTARAAAEGAAGEIHVGYAMSPTVRILPKSLRAFQDEMPHLKVKLHDLSTEEMLTGLREGKLDMAIMVHAHAAMLRGLNSHDLSRQTICLAVAPKHPLSAKESVTLAEAAKFPLVSFNPTEYPDYGDMLNDTFSPAKITPRIGEEHDSVASLIAAVEAGDGVALVTESLACIAGPRLKLLRISPAPKPLVVAAVWPESGLSPAGQRFLACAKKAALEK